MTANIYVVMIIFYIRHFQKDTMVFPRFLSTLLLSVSFSAITPTFAQDHERVFDQQLSFSCDNDFFAFRGTDRYYTNGLFLKYSTVGKSKHEKTVKQLNEWEVGQMIYTPYKREILAITEMDRPVSGYLYGKFSRSNFTAPGRLFSWGVSIGAIGKASMAKQVINDFHPFININSDWWGWVWDYQVKDEIGVNAHGKYAFSLIKKEGSLFQVTPVTNLTLGTTFTNASGSILFQFGRFNRMAQSDYWNAKIDKTGLRTSKRELFLFYQPEVMYQGYDATIQGGMFRSDKGSVVWPIEPVVFTHHVGISFANKRYSLAFHEFYETKRAKYQFNNHSYGRIQMGYRF